MPPRPGAQAFALPPRFLCPNVSRTFLRTIRSIDQKPHPNNRFNNNSTKLPTLQASRRAAFLRKEPVLPFRVGALAIKKGMTGIYDPVTAKRTACTVLQLDRCQVVSHKRRDKHGYWAVQVGCGSKEVDNVTRPERGHFAAAGVPLKRHLAEFRVRNEGGLSPVGTHITADLFVAGQYVDARADTRGMGFAGGMKRHGFSGQPASHGNSLTHRAHGLRRRVAGQRQQGVAGQAHGRSHGWPEAHRAEPQGAPGRQGEWDCRGARRRARSPQVHRQTAGCRQEAMARRAQVSTIARGCSRLAEAGLRLSWRTGMRMVELTGLIGGEGGGGSSSSSSRQRYSNGMTCRQKQVWHGCEDAYTTHQHQECCDNGAAHRTF